MSGMEPPREDGLLVTHSWSMPGYADPPDGSMVGTPPRRPSSVRRTSHLSATFPDGYGMPMHLTGRSRDLRTDVAGDAEPLAEFALHVVVDPSRTITAASMQPDRDEVAELVGLNAGRGFRAAAAAAFATDREVGSALYFLLDDVSIVSGIGGVAWSQHRPMVIPGELSSGKGEASFQRTTSGRVACSGLRPGGYQQISRQQGINFPHWVRVAGDLSQTQDAWAWHDIEPAPAVCLRRRRRVDVWREPDEIHVDAHYRDSIYGREGLEVALHEYTVNASLAAGSGNVLSIDAGSKVLPFPECPLAALEVGKLTGMNVADFRTSVPETLRELEGCTHLNDMLRGLRDVPALAAQVQ